MSKIIFTYILGYKVDVGHMEAVNLISSHKYSEKQIVSPLMSSCLVACIKVQAGIFSSDAPNARKFGLLKIGC